MLKTSMCVGRSRSTEKSRRLNSFQGIVGAIVASLPRVRLGAHPNNREVSGITMAIGRAIMTASGVTVFHNATPRRVSGISQVAIPCNLSRHPCVLPPDSDHQRLLLEDADARLPC